jgi:hypothetical protein
LRYRFEKADKRAWARCTRTVRTDHEREARHFGVPAHVIG